MESKKEIGTERNQNERRRRKMCVELFIQIPQPFWRESFSITTNHHKLQTLILRRKKGKKKEKKEMKENLII